MNERTHCLVFSFLSPPFVVVVVVATSFNRHREKIAKNKYMEMYMLGRNKQKEEARKREQRRVLMQRYKKQRKEEVRVLWYFVSSSIKSLLLSILRL